MERSPVFWCHDQDLPPTESQKRGAPRAGPLKVMPVAVLRGSSPVSWKAGKGASEFPPLPAQSGAPRMQKALLLLEHTDVWLPLPRRHPRLDCYPTPTDRVQVEDFVILCPCLLLMQISFISSSSFFLKKSNHEILTDVVGSPRMEQSQFLDPPLTKERKDHLASGKC